MIGSVAEEPMVCMTLSAGGTWIRNFSSALPSVVSRVAEIRDAGKTAGHIGVRFDSLQGRTWIRFPVDRLRFQGFVACLPVCRLESLRIPLKARICTKATGSKKAARRGEVPLGFGTFDPASAQAGLYPHGRSVAARIFELKQGC